ncbi:hypothetical protein QN277_016808 [Acacia crassicarpa]|uniref:Non-haem dioxygenase N-terminal domain-containing protein n=1 Tax=Acacia crassicarpa TaxID=499986 RepID=A0AAE1MXB7_9FABA|nr:hypothetical protein QN277_016808 [Acacia crassicarpa]
MRKNGMAKISNIPVIDLQEFADNPKELKNKLREACEDWGCFRLMNHQIYLNLMAEIKKVVRSLLDLPLEIKMRNTEQVIAGSGYMAPSATNPLYEGLGLYNMASSHAVQSFCSASPHQTSVSLSFFLTFICYII